MGLNGDKGMKKFFPALIILLVIFFPGLAIADTVGALMPGKNVPYYMVIHHAMVEELEELGADAEVILQRPAPTKMAWKNATRKLVILGARVIVAYGSEAALTVIEENTDVPVIYTAAYDPIGSGLAGKATGMSASVPLESLIGNLKKIANFSKLGILYSSDEKSSVMQMEAATELALKLGANVIKIDTKGIDSPDLSGSDAVLFTSSAEINQKENLEKIINMARSQKIVTASVMCASCQNGVLLSLSADPEHQGKGAAKMVAAILDGKNPQDIPPNDSPKVNLTVNLKEAKDLGISIPFELLGTSNIIK